MDKELINIINIIKEYINGTPTTNFDDFFSKNKNILSINLVDPNIQITKDNLKFLYSWVIKGVNTDLIIDYYNNSKIKIEKEELIGVEVNNYLDLSEYNFLQLILKYGSIKIFPTKTVFLWNNERYTNFEIGKLYETPEKNGISVKYVSYDEILKLYNKNKEFYRNNNLLLNFNNLSRIIGLPISNKSFKLDYIIPIDISNFRFDVYVNDNIYFNEFQITIDKVSKYFKDVNYDNIIENFIFILIKKLKNDNIYIEYFKLFVTYSKLTYYITYLFPDNVVSKEDKFIYDDKIDIYEHKNIFDDVEDIICEHEEVLKRILKPTPDYFKNLNIFAKEYIEISNNISICKICHETISMFDQDEKLYVQKDGSIVLTSIKDNIFEYDPYKSFIDAQVFFVDALNIFDNLFKTNIVNNINSIAKLCIDFFVYLSENRLEFEKDKKYKKNIIDGNLFFLRLSNKFFLYTDDKEEYLKKKILNMNIIVILVTLVFSGFDSVKQILSNKKFIDIFEKKRMNDVNLYNYFISRVVFKFFKKSKIPITDVNDILTLVDIYTSLFVDELKILYNINLNTFNDNLKNIEGNDELYIFILKPVDFKENQLEYFPSKNYYIKNTIDFFHKGKEEENIIVNDFINFLDSLYSYNELNKNESIKNDIEKILNISLFPKLYWENTEIKIRPKELTNDIFIINLDKTNKFVNINDSFYSNNIKIVGDFIYCFFHFGDPYPFVKNLSVKHFKRNLDSILRLVIYFFPDINIPSDLSIYIKYEEYNDRIYIYYLYYVIFNYLTKDKLLDWLNKNKDTILILYNQEHNKYYNYE